MNSITEKAFGIYETLPVTEYTLVNTNGMEVSVLNFGGVITRIITPDKNGEQGNVVLRFQDLNGYIKNGNQYIGCIAGRYCNRIAQGKFSLDGKAYQLAINNFPNTLHGGTKGFDKAWWDIEKIEEDRGLKLSYISEDNEEGYPGKVLIEILYTLTPGNALKIEYTATSDKATPINLTNHSYFNLSAGKCVTILDHELEINADLFTPVDENLIPTGKVKSVKNTLMDFTVPKRIGHDIHHLSEGYDINMVLNKSSDKAAKLYDPLSGRTMNVYTTEPGLQFYSGNYLRDIPGGNGFPNTRYGALCLEAQHFPNSPNEPEFPNTILRPGEVYRQTTVYEFSLKEQV